ncbi:hypothetical protein FA13DRAFT_1735095 [Coprinellus micaceus]|uniref:Uncharacterized protein n=1 Tax=Coprinellus micaceus TaxID=71717 RepID=A0A4Y7T5U4_COPMI|nr:hypothetical protein FA13DRAFT_1735095 [Coprinellus micaceus]
MPNLIIGAFTGKQQQVCGGNRATAQKVSPSDTHSRTSLSPILIASIVDTSETEDISKESRLWKDISGKTEPSGQTLSWF